MLRREFLKQSVACSAGIAGVCGCVGESRRAIGASSHDGGSLARPALRVHTRIVAASTEGDD